PAPATPSKISRRGCCRSVRPCRGASGCWAIDVALEAGQLVDRHVAGEARPERHHDMGERDMGLEPVEHLVEFGAGRALSNPEIVAARRAGQTIVHLEAVLHMA